MSIKNIIYTLLFLPALIGCEKNTYIIYAEKEEEEIVIEENTNPYDIIHDDIFYNYLLEQFDTDKDGKLSSGEANVVKEIKYNAGTYHFKSLKDLEKFPNLEKLCLHSFYGINTLHLTNNTKLKILNISETSANLNLSKNTELKELYFTNCRYVKTLTLSGNPELQILDCSNSSIESLNLQHNTKLTELNISNIQLCDFNLGDKTELLKMDIAHTTFPNFTLDLSNAPKLKTLSLYHNNTDYLPPLNLDIRNTSIEKLTALSNVWSLNAKGCQSLKYLSCSSHAFLIDASESGIEEILYSSIALEYDTWGRGEEFNPNKFHQSDPTAAASPVLLLNNCPNLKEFYYYQKITGWIPGEVPDHMGRIKIDISNCASLTKFFANHVAELKIDNCPALEEFTCKGSYTLP